MRINYPKRSKFIEKCEDCIRQNKDGLLTGNMISVDLSEFPKSGYGGKNIRVNIEKTENESFNAYWKSTQPSRFPVRIKAAAHALFRQECFGKFVIFHKAGNLTISLD